MLYTTLKTLPLASRPAASPAPVSHHVPLSYGLAGLVLLCVGGFLVARAADALARGEWGAPAMLGAVHAFTLGWLLTLIIGTLYQLGPVALQVSPRSATLWRWLLPFHVIGVLVVVGSVSVGRMDIAGSGWLLLAITTTASAIVLLGPFRAPEGTRARMRLVTAGFLALGATLLLAFFRLFWGLGGVQLDLTGLRLAHVAFGLVGFGTLIAWALGTHVLPMFLGTRAVPSVSSRAVPWLLIAACLLTLPTLRPGLEGVRAVAAIVAAAGQSLIVWYGFSWFRRRASVALDPALATVAMAFVALALATLLQMTMAIGVLTGAVPVSTGIWPRLVAVWGVLFLAGWLSLLIAGVLLRVFVFLSWMVRAGPGVRPAGAPPLRVSEFSRPTLAWTSVILFGLAILMLSVTIAAGSAFGARLSALLYSTAALVMLLHHALALFAPPRDVAPLPIPTALSTASS